MNRPDDQAAAKRISEWRNSLRSMSYDLGWCEPCWAYAPILSATSSCGFCGRSLRAVVDGETPHLRTRRHPAL